MARLIHHETFPGLSVARPVDLGRVLLTLVQLAALGGIGLFLMLAIINTVLGAPQSDPAYSPY